MAIESARGQTWQTFAQPALFYNTALGLVENAAAKPKAIWQVVELLAELGEELVGVLPDSEVGTKLASEIRHMLDPSRLITSLQEPEARSETPVLSQA